MSLRGLNEVIADTQDLAARLTNISFIDLLGTLNLLKGNSVGFHQCLVGKEICG